MEPFYFDPMAPCFFPLSLDEPSPVKSTHFKAAGCFFNDDRYFLAGYQQTKATPRISGIGGAKNPGETPVQTALRETLEELFDLPQKLIPRELLEELETFVPPRRVVQNHSYFLVCYTFEDLETMLMILGKVYTDTPLYDTFPRTITDLLFQRKIKKESEISHLALLPFVDHPSKAPFVCTLLLADCNLILKEYATESSVAKKN